MAKGILKILVETLLICSLFTTISVNCDSSRNGSLGVVQVENIKIVNRGMTGLQKDSQKWMMMKDGQPWNNNFEDSNSVTTDAPPPYYEVAKMARYIVMKSNWTSIATISARSPTTGFPFANIFSVSDGPIGKSTGIPYMYVTPLDLSIQDLKKNSRASLTMSLAQGKYCSNNLLDPEDPRCAHVILSGTMLQLTSGSEEEAFAQQSMFSRHPVMSQWPKDHGFFFAKLNIDSIFVLDYFGGAKNVDVKEYYKTVI